jgi:hypothetical protein
MASTETKTPSFTERQAADNREDMALAEARTKGLDEGDRIKANALTTYKNASEQNKSRRLARERAVLARVVGYTRTTLRPLVLKCASEGTLAAAGALAEAIVPCLDMEKVELGGNTSGMPIAARVVFHVLVDEAAAGAPGILNTLAQPSPGERLINAIARIGGAAGQRIAMQSALLEVGTIVEATARSYGADAPAPSIPRQWAAIKTCDRDTFAEFQADEVAAAEAARAAAAPPAPTRPTVREPAPIIDGALDVLGALARPFRN